MAAAVFMGMVANYQGGPGLRRLTAVSSIGYAFPGTILAIGVVTAAAALVTLWLAGPRRSHEIVGQGREFEAEHVAESPERVQRAADGTAPRRPESRPESRSVPSAEAALRDAATEPITTPNEPVRARAPTRPQPRDASSDSPTPPRPDRLEAEARLMGTARDALAAGNNERVLEILAEHERRFADGTLTLEREAWSLVARCRRGDLDTGVARAAFERAHPSSRWVPAIDRACNEAKSGDGNVATGSTGE